MKKRILSVLLSLCLFMCLLPATVFAADVVQNPTATAAMNEEYTMKMQPYASSGGITLFPSAFGANVRARVTSGTAENVQFGSPSKGTYANGYNCLDYPVTFSAEGTYRIRVDFSYTYSLNPTGPNAQWFTATFNWTFTVGDSSGSVDKPNPPTISDLNRFRNYVNSTSSSQGADLYVVRAVSLRPWCVV